VPGLSDPAIVALQEARYRTACGFVGPGMRVLDLACGVGNGSRLLMRTGAKVIGVDYDLPALRQGRRIFRKSPGRVVAANALRLPFPDGGFDAVVCFELIEHLKEQDALLGELCRVLRAGGRLLLSTPNRLTEKSLDAPGGPGVSPHHVKTLSPGELRGLLRRYFRSVRIRSFRRRGSRLYAVLRRLDVFNLRLKLGWRARESVARRLGAGAAERGWSARSFVLARGGLRQAINLLASCTAPTTTRQKRAGTAMIVSASYPPDRGGVSDHSALLAGYLAARGVSVRVCTTGGCGMVGPGEPGLLYLRDTWSVCGARRIAQAVAREAPACLVFQYVPHMYGRAGVALGAALFPWFSRIRRVPVITHFHEVCVPWSVHPLHFLQALVHRIQAVVMTAGSRGVVFANRRVAEIMKPWVRLLRRPCEVLPSGPTIPIVEVPGPRLAQVRSVWAHSGEALVVVYGLASRGKRYDLALRALAKLRAGGSPVRLLMLGDQEAGDARYCQEVREETRRMGLEAAVTWSGPLPAAEITEILASANCMWNLQSGGLTARNATAACAFAVGLPVVAFGGRLLDSCFRDGENVILAPADAEAFAAATQRLLSSPEVAAQLRRNGRALYEQSFSWRVIAGRYLELLAAMGVAVG
jgi:glycosyltransferase involved in cell wall biosynthesis